MNNYKEVLRASGYSIIIDNVVNNHINVVAKGSEFAWILTETANEFFKGIKIPADQVNKALDILGDVSKVELGNRAFELYNNKQLTGVYVIYATDNLRLNYNNLNPDFVDTNTTTSIYTSCKHLASSGLNKWAVAIEVFGCLLIAFGILAGIICALGSDITLIAPAVYLVFGGLGCFLVSSILRWMNNIELYHDSRMR